MRRFRFDETVGHAITQFGSQMVSITGIQRTSGPTQIAAMRIGPGGVVGYHQATTPQLFLIVAGEGWVTSENHVRQPISEGYAVFWETDEWHESGSDTGMTAIVIEGDGLRPDQVMREEPAAE